MDSNEMISLLSQILDEKIGMVTAYAYAKSKGYSGSADDFANDMANIGVNISAIETAINTFNNQTVPYAETAITTAGSNQVTAVNTAGQEQLQNVTAEGGRQVGLVADAGSAKTEAVNAAGASQVENVNTAGMTQVTNINNAGASQITAIQTKGEETRATIPADYTTLSNDVTDLEAAIANGYQSISTLVNGSFSANGNLSTRSDRLREETFIYVKSGDKIIINAGTLKYEVGAWNGTPSTETNVRNDSTWRENGETIVSDFDGYYIIIFAKQNTSETITPSDFDGYIHVFANEIYRNSHEIAVLQTDVETLGESVSSAVTRVDAPIYTNIPTEITKAQGYYSAANAFTDNASYEHTQIISVEAGDIITPVSTDANAYFRFVTAYKDNVCIYDAGTNSAVTSYTVPENINGVRFSVLVSHDITAVRIKRRTGTETVYYPLTQGLGYVNWKGDIESGQSVELMGTNVRFNTVWCFTGHISTMGKITLAVKTTGGTVKELCSVDATNLYYRLNNGNIASVAHGLTIAEDLQIRIDSPFKVNELGGIRICSDGVEYTLAEISYGTDMNGVPYLLSTGAVMTDCAFSWIPKDIDKPIWVFGDSWVSMYDTRWVYYMVRDGYTNSWMLNGFAGEDTDEAYDSLLNLLTIRKPDYIVWLLGMNNGDPSTAVNSSWKTVYDKLVQLCTDYKINLILYTVPNTPTINNNFKNAIVRASGYRYIDGAAAVGDDGSGNWFTGFEQSSSDHNHTSGKGARALYYRILADFPEIAGNSL